MLIINPWSTTDHLSFPSRRVITVSSRCVWASLPSTLSALATTSCGIQPASCAVPALSYWWTWSTSGRKESCTVDATMATARSRAAAAVTRWEDVKSVLEILSGFDSFSFKVCSSAQSTFWCISIHSWSSVMSTRRPRARTGIWSTSAVLNVIASSPEKHTSWRTTNPSASPATWRTTLWWDGRSLSGFLLVVNGWSFSICLSGYDQLSKTSLFVSLLSTKPIQGSLGAWYGFFQTLTITDNYHLPLFHILTLV